MVERGNPVLARYSSNPVCGGGAARQSTGSRPGQHGGSCDHGADSIGRDGQALCFVFFMDRAEWRRGGDPKAMSSIEKVPALDAAAGAGGDSINAEHGPNQAAAHRRSIRSLLVDARSSGSIRCGARTYTYIPMARASFTWWSSWMGEPRVAGVAISNTLAADFCVEATRGSARAIWTPEIFNTDQGSQFTSGRTSPAPSKRTAVMIACDGKPTTWTTS